MPAKKHTPEGDLSSGLFESLGRLEGTGGGVVPTDLDAALLWQVVQILFQRGASIQVGVTKDKSAWSVQFWDGKFPEKRYFRETYEFNRTLAAIVVVHFGKDITPEWREIVSVYGW